MSVEATFLKTLVLRIKKSRGGQIRTDNSIRNKVKSMKPPYLLAFGNDNGNNEQHRTFPFLFPILTA